MPPIYSKALLDRIRERLSITALISERVVLKRAGRNHKGLCPFHSEKTPSFNVADDKGIYHCFGCGEGGDIFQFVMKCDGLSFAEAVRWLAGRAGVELPRDFDPSQRAAEDETERKRRLGLAMNAIARDHFHRQLMDERAGATARAYLQKREIKTEFFTQLFLGFADNSWDRLVAHLAEKGASLDLAAEIGLVKRRERGGHYDFFRNRVIFPIVSVRGEVVGFSGRDIGDGGDGAKYLNSPDSFLYHKSSSVYGLDRARGQIQHLDSAVIVEGNLDVVTLHQAGIANAVAPLGTALTAGHIRLLARYTRNMTLVFDGDDAGRRAAARSLEICIGEGISPRVVSLPDGEDPDSLVKREGAEAFKGRLSRAESLFEHSVERTIAETGSDAAGKVAALERVVPLLKSAADPGQRAVYRAFLARRLEVDERSLDLSARSGTRASAPTPASPEAKEARIAPSAERMLIEAIMRRSDLAPEAFSQVEPGEFEDERCREVAAIIKEHLERDGRVAVSDVIQAAGDEGLARDLRRMAIGSEELSEEEAEALARDCIERIKGRRIARRMRAINDDIREAERQGEDERLFDLLAEKRALSAEAHGR